MRAATTSLLVALLMVSVVGCGDDKTKTHAGGDDVGEKTPDPPQKEPEKTPDITDLTAGVAAGQQWHDNRLKMKFCWCPAGKYTMGSPKNEKNRDDEEDQVSVTLSRGFWLGKYAVTQAQWKTVMGTQPWAGKTLVKEGDDYPATYVGWEDAVKFCAELTKKDRSSGKFNKPTITVSTRWLGASPAEVEKEIVVKQEEQFNGVKGLIVIHSVCRKGRGEITLEFSPGADIRERLIDVANALQQVREYPPDAEKPRIRTVNMPADWEYRLPTEAQWEYACRAGSKTRYGFGDDESRLGDYAWFVKNARDVGEMYAHRVGVKRANAWGLYDMHGNIFEWCRDWYKKELPGGTDPEATTKGSIRMLRGGCWNGSSGGCRCASRYEVEPGKRGCSLGFRLAAVQLTR